LINADLEVGGRIRQQHYRVDAPYVANRPSETNNVTAIDMPVFRALCAGDDGCPLTMIMKDYDSAHNRDASFGPVHFEYDARGPTHGYQTAAFATSDSYVAGYASTDNDATTGDAIRAWNCFLSDSNPRPPTPSLPHDSSRGAIPARTRELSARPVYNPLRRQRRAAHPG
jgi:hypothetical protein